MNRLALFVLTLIGALVLVYTASFYAGSDPLALAITLTIALAFFVGVAELIQFDRRLTGLWREAEELGAKSAESAEGELPRLSEIALPLRDHLRGALGLAPAPSLVLTLTPYLVGLLVMLGLLGTFLGLFETLRGAHSALSTSQDIASLRDGLKAPMHGLMRSFGTSAAGVACSAILGLLAVLARGSLGGLYTALRGLAQDRFKEQAPAARQEAALERLADQMAAQGESLPAAASSLGKLAEELGGIEAALSGSMKAMAETLVRANQEALMGIREGLSGALEAGVAKLGEDLSKERGALDEARASFGERLTELVALFERQEERLGTLESKRDAENETRQRALIGKLDELIGGIGERAETAEAAQEARTERLLASIEEAESGRRARLDRELEAIVQAAEASARETIEAITSGEEARASKLDALMSSMDARGAEQLERFRESASALIEDFRAEREGKVGEEASRFEALLEAQRSQQASLEEGLGARFETLLQEVRERASGDRDRLFEAAASFSEGVRAENERLLAQLAEGEGAQAERLGAIGDRLSELLKVEQGLVEARREESGAIAQRLSEEFSALAGRLSSHFEGESRALVERLDSLSAANAEQLGRILAANEEARGADREGAKALLQAIDESRDAELEALAGLSAGLEAMSSAQDARAEGLIESLGEARETERAELAELKRALVQLLEEQAHSFGRDLSKHAEELSSSLAGTEGAIKEAAGAMLASGAELGALAEGFSASVEAHNEGAKAWREGLGEVEALIIEAGEGAAAEALSVHLERTHELFDRQLRFQRELLAELRELSASPEIIPEISQEMSQDPLEPLEGAPPIEPDAQLDEERDAE